MQRLPVFVIIVIVIVSASSCANVKNFQYLQGEYDTVRISKVQVPEAIIQEGDLLGITVFSDDPLATAAVVRQTGSTSPMGLSFESSASTALPSAATGYLVNQNGNLELYKVGLVRAKGLTKDKLADTLEHLYSKLDLLKNPHVEVRFLNFKITVIGEVSRPGPFSIPTDRVNVFEAIGLAGDITVFGRRDNILIVRESNGVRSFGYINLKDPNAFLSPYYYLRQNDLIIVDVSKNKSSVNNQSTFQMVSLAATLISVSAVVYSIIR